MGVLYHGSNTGGIAVLEPRPTVFMDDRPLVWATPSRAIALSFVGRWDDQDIKHQTIDGKPRMTERVAGAFETHFKGVKAFIYTVSSEGFTDEDDRLYNYELFNPNPVPVLSVEEIDDAWDALQAQTEIELVRFQGDSMSEEIPPPPVKTLTLVDFFLEGLKKEAYIHKSWVIELFAISKTGEWVVREEGKPPYGHFGDDGIIHLEGAVEGKRLFDPQDTLILNPGDLPNVKEKIETTYGVALINAIVLCYAFGGKVPYINDDPISGEKLDAMVAKLLVDYPPQGQARDPNRVYVDELMRYLEACSALAGFGTIFSPTASPKALTINPAILKRRDELFKEYAGQLNDPVIVAKIDKELTDMDKADFKGDPAENFFIKSKSFDVARKKTLISYGMELGFNPDNPTFIPQSLADGLDFNNMPAIADSARSGSYSRGFMTAMGGQSVKDLYRVFQNAKIAEEDCGAKTGIPSLVSKNLMDYHLGRYMLQDGALVRIDETVVKALLGKFIELRSPMACKTKPPYFCARCVGDRTALNPNGVHVEISDIGSAFMYAEMKAMHGKSLSTAKYDISTALS